MTHSDDDRFVEQRRREQARRIASRGADYRPRTNDQRSDGYCLCEICHMLNRDPTIVPGVFAKLVKITWLS